MSQSESVEHSFTIGESATLACLLEVSVPKVGNVHRGADFDDATFYDFVVSASCLGKVFDFAESRSVGELVLDSVQATKQLIGTNTNLGMILLFAPLAKCKQEPSRLEVLQVLDALAETDCQQVMEAIRLANPGGMGKVSSHDVRDGSKEVQIGLVELMQLAESRDTIARQYANGFAEFFDCVLPIVYAAMEDGQSLPDSLVLAHLKIMSEIPDTLIARKCGPKVSEECSVRAARIVSELQVGSSEYHDAIAEFDFWLRSDGHRRNPGTTADLLAAGVFVGLKSGTISTRQLNRGLSLARSSLAKSQQV